MGVPIGTTGTEIPYDKGTWMAIAAFTAVAWYNIAELNIQVFLTFKRHRGLYFWSLLISGYGCVLHALGFLLKFFQLTSNNYLSVTIITIGWYCMVTGQAVVLYSRLHLVVREQKLLRGILAMIIIDAICFHIPSTILTYASNLPEPAGTKFVRPFGIVEKLQMTAFCIQEFIISGVYVWSTIRLLKPVYHGRTRKVMTQLIWINLIIIGMDACLLAMEYSNIYEIEATLKAMVYSIKLKLEFAVLNQLMTLANSSVNNHQNLHIEDGHDDRPAPGRSKSTEYISSKYKKPDKWTKHQARSKSRPHAPVPAQQNSFGPNNKHRFQWVPTLDRNAVIETQHIENTNIKDQEPNVFTNPAACFKPGRRWPDDSPGRDGLSDIGDSPILSPADECGTSTPGSRRGRKPPDLEVDSLIMPNGLLRSTRPSVSDWAHGPDSDASPTSDEMCLNPYDSSRARPLSSGNAYTGTEMASRDITRPKSIDFMTSALRS